ncbi:MAG: thioredoxin family protein [Anaerolineae bacterium]|nr:thioredoxin family protein [Anaerolineae bacterium]MDW8072083.1 thioredoxin family protein [Anaerolineae bacterium]
MGLLKEQDKNVLRQAFQALQQPVQLVVFTQPMECMYCRETREIVEEVAELSDKITLEVFDFTQDRAAVDRYTIRRIPAIVVMRGGDQPKDFGIRFYGIPAGYEFTPFIEDILMVSRGDSGLSEASRALLAQLTKPLHIQVFVAPTCPYCPQAVRLAHQMALQSDLVQADMIEITEFPHLALFYQVQGVPRIVINDRIKIDGALPEAALMEWVKEAMRS